MVQLKQITELFKESSLGRIGFILLCFFTFLALLAPVPVLLAPSVYHPITGIDPLITGVSGPSFKHLFGTDFMGRDIFSQLLSGAQLAFLVGIVSSFLSVFLGTTVGLVSGYFGRWVDTLLMRFVDIIMTLPDLPLMVVIATVVGRLNIWVIIILISMFGWAGVARIIRSQVLSLRERPYVEAARVSGAGHIRIMFYHIGPNVLPLCFLYMTLGVSSAILSEAGLSFIGLGDASRTSWGMMLQWAFRQGNMEINWILPPGLCISFLSLSFYLVGKGLEEAIHPRLRSQ